MENMVNSLARGLRILRSFSPDNPKQRLIDITSRTELPKTTVIRLLKTLTSLNYVRYDPNDRKYYLGAEVLSLGFGLLSGMGLREAALPYIEELSRMANQNVNLGILDRSEVIYIERIRKRTILNINHPVGSRLSAYKTSSGKAILAFLDKEELEKVLREILQEIGSIDFVGPKGVLLLEELGKVRETGYALADGDLVPGLKAIGAPIFNEKGCVQGAISMPFLGQAFSKEEIIETYVPMLVDTAKMISAARGYRQDSGAGREPDSLVSTR